MGASAREAAVQLLQQVETGERHSGEALDALLRRTVLSPADQALVSRLFYGVLERRLTLDYVLSACSSVKLKKMHPAVRNNLRAGAYQLLYMDKIPSSAAVNEAVTLTRTLRQPYAAGLTNAVLRAVQRRQAELLSALPEDAAGLAVRYSCPEALIACWQRDYGPERTLSLLRGINAVPPNTLRINTLQVTADHFLRRLEAEGIRYTRHPLLPECVEIADAAAIKGLESLLENWYYHQDAASQFCCAALDTHPGERVADVCAAPGGKSFTTAQRMENRGALLSCDIYPGKCRTMEQRAQAFGVTIMRTAARDASAPCPEPLRGAFDRVLCDVPCSGWGVIRRKPEIRYKDPASFDALPELQYRILEQSAQMVRPGGVLQYSTCTWSRRENEEVAARFLEAHPEFAPRVLPLDGCFAAAGQTPGAYITLFPDVHGTDGFFIAGFVRKADGNPG